eukprot:scaffold69515_cov58-Attheya_sp.AAC.2
MEIAVGPDGATAAAAVPVAVAFVAVAAAAAAAAAAAPGDVAVRAVSKSLSALIVQMHSSAASSRPESISALARKGGMILIRRVVILGLVVVSALGWRARRVALSPAASRSLHSGTSASTDANTVAGTVRTTT